MLLKLFRWVALFEGLTTIALFVIAMPLKYGFGNDALIRPFGSLHGAAVVLYFAVMLLAFSASRISAAGWMRSTLAALIPFGTFVNDPWLHRQIQARA